MTALAVSLVAVSRNVPAPLAMISCWEVPAYHFCTLFSRMVHFKCFLGGSKLFDSFLLRTLCSIELIIHFNFTARFASTIWNEDKYDFHQAFSIKKLEIRLLWYGNSMISNRYRDTLTTKWVRNGKLERLRWNWMKSL